MMPKKKLTKEIKDLINAQIEVEGFDYAVVEKMGPDDWEEGALPDDIKNAWNDYLKARETFKEALRAYGIDPQ